MRADPAIIAVSAAMPKCLGGIRLPLKPPPDRTIVGWKLDRGVKT